MSGGLRRLIFKCGGTMVVLLGILHLAVTPIIARLIKDNVTNEAASWLTPPMLLNRVMPLLSLRMIARQMVAR